MVVILIFVHFTRIFGWSRHGKRTKLWEDINKTLPVPKKNDKKNNEIVYLTKWTIYMCIIWCDLNTCEPLKRACVWNEKLKHVMRVLPNGKRAQNGNINGNFVCAVMRLMREISTIIIQIIGQTAHHSCSQIPITRHKLTFVFKTLQSLSMKWLSFKSEFR